jgi:hypothetical protein
MNHDPVYINLHEEAKVLARQAAERFAGNLSDTLNDLRREYGDPSNWRATAGFSLKEALSHWTFNSVVRYINEHPPKNNNQASLLERVTEPDLASFQKNGSARPVYILKFIGGYICHEFREMHTLKVISSVNKDDCIASELDDVIISVFASYGVEEYIDEYWGIFYT